MFKNCNPVIIIGLIGLMGISCLNPADNNRPGKPDTDAVRIAVAAIAADYSAGNFEIVSAKDYTVASNLQPGLHYDLSIRASGSGVYILERNGKDNVVKYNAGNMVIEYQENIGAGINIQDIAIITDTKAYISCHNSGELIIFNPKTGKRVSAIDMSRFNTYAGTDSAEASPFIGALAVHGSYVYAACQRLKTVQESWGTNIVAGDTSLIAVIDARTDAVVKSIALNKKNPASMSILGGKMLVACTGDWYDASTGGVEIIDLAGGVNAGVAVEGGEFGGSVSNVVFVSADKAYIAVGKISDDFSSFYTEIVAFNPSTGGVGAKLSGIGDGFGGLAFDGSRVYVGDRELGAAAVAVVNPNTNAVERKIATEMPPAGLAVIYPD